MFSMNQEWRKPIKERYCIIMYVIRDLSCSIHEFYSYCKNVQFLIIVCVYFCVMVFFTRSFCWLMRQRRIVLKLSRVVTLFEFFLIHVFYYVFRMRILLRWIGGCVLVNYFWTPPPHLSILYMITFSTIFN